MYRKLDCECKHEYADHPNDVCTVSQCPCTSYDPAGHNPELLNFMCPQCRKVRLEKTYARTYECPICHYIMFEKQILEAMG